MLQRVPLGTASMAKIRPVLFRAISASTQTRMLSAAHVAAATELPLTLPDPIAHPLLGAMLPYHKATVGHLRTFILPQEIFSTTTDLALGRAMINTWRRDGIFQIRLTRAQATTFHEALQASKLFFGQPDVIKAQHVDDQSFAGYIASGEELTGGIADYSETFTVTKDLPLSDPRVQRRWPCHGPCPWPNSNYATTMQALMRLLSESGEKLLKLTSLGLGLANPNALTRLTEDGWHHMRILRFPQVDRTNGKGKKGRGVGSHTDYGLLVIAAQDEVGGLFVRPPVEEENLKNWEKSSAGFCEDDEKWTYVPPVQDTLTVFPGDMMQYLTNSFLHSTPHKVGLNTRERFAFAYFHEPNFSAVVKPLEEYNGSNKDERGIHYGTHFTNMFMRNYPERITAQRIRAENRMATLPSTVSGNF